MSRRLYHTNRLYDSQYIPSIHPQMIQSEMGWIRITIQFHWFVSGTPQYSFPWMMVECDLDGCSSMKPHWNHWSLFIDDRMGSEPVGTDIIVYFPSSEWIQNLFFHWSFPFSYPHKIKPSNHLNKVHPVMMIIDKLSRNKYFWLLTDYQIIHCMVCR